MQHLRLLGALSAVLFLTCQAAIAQPVSHDPNHGGNLSAITDNGIIDLGEGNIAIVDVGFNLNDISQFLFQTREDFVIYDNGGFDGTFPGETTIQAAAPLELVYNDGLDLIWELAGVGAPGPNNFFKMYYDWDGVNFTGNSDIGTGTGFDDGTLILDAYFTSFYLKIDTDDPAGTMLAELAIVGYDSLSFDIPGFYTATLDGLTFFPTQIPPSSSIVGHTTTGSDLLPSVDLTLDFEAIPEVNTMLLTGLGLVAMAATLRRRRQAA